MHTRVRVLKWGLNYRVEVIMMTQDVPMGHTVRVNGAQYKVTDEPKYVRAYGDHQMIEWVITPVPDGTRTGRLTGRYRVWPDRQI